MAEEFDIDELRIVLTHDRDAEVSLHDARFKEDYARDHAFRAFTRSAGFCEGYIYLQIRSPDGIATVPLTLVEATKVHMDIGRMCDELDARPEKWKEFKARKRLEKKKRDKERASSVVSLKRESKA